MKRKKEDLPDILISKANFYGENLDFFFMAASVTRVGGLKPKKTLKAGDLIRLKPERF